MANIGELAVETHSFWKIKVNTYQKIYKHYHNHTLYDIKTWCLICDQQCDRIKGREKDHELSHIQDIDTWWYSVWNIW